MLSTLVVHAPAGSGGPGRVRASVHGCVAVPPAVELRGTGLPWSALLGADQEAGGGAMPVGVAVRGTERLTRRNGAIAPFGTTTNPYSTLGDHPPGRPLS
jgi:hypothetical protein